MSRENNLEGNGAFNAMSSMMMKVIAVIKTMNWLDILSTYACFPSDYEYAQKDLQDRYEDSALFLGGNKIDGVIKMRTRKRKDSGYEEVRTVE